MTRILKRAFDVIVAAMSLVLLSPLLGLIALGIKLFQGSPVVFRQERPGLAGVPFEILKFRTMRESRSSGETDREPDSHRITSLGLFLRRTSLDELPELWNVLRGDMSLVGPRPLLMEYLSLYTREQARRHDVRPGITGWAQVNGRNALSWEEKFELDVWYVGHWTTWLDFKILWMTVVKVVKREGISAEGHATMPRFEGTKN